MQRRRSRGDLERDVLAVLTAAEQSMTPAEVRDTVDPGLAYTTVMTVLARLHAKGLVTRRPVGRGFAYSGTPDPMALTAQRMQRLLAAGVDRAGVLARFVDGLSPADEKLLRELLADQDES